MRFFILLFLLILFCSSNKGVSLEEQNNIISKGALKEQMRDGFLARCNIPKQMKQGKTYRVELRVSDNKDSELTLNLGDTSLVYSIKLCESMVADLNGNNFKITPKDSNRQTLSPYTATVWRWDVTPLKHGSTELEINVYCLVVDSYGNRNIPPIKIKTYTEKLDVEINIKNMFIDILMKYWLKIIIFIGSSGAISYIIGMIKKMKKQKEKKMIKNFLNSK